MACIPGLYRRGNVWWCSTGVLNRILRLAYENGKLLQLPVIRKLKEAAALTFSPGGLICQLGFPRVSRLGRSLVL